MEGNNDRAFNTLLLEVQQQFLWYREKSNQRLDLLEDLVEVAAQQMEILKKEKIQQRGLGTLKNPFVEARTTGSESLEPVPHLKLHFPSYRRGNNQQLDYKTDTEIFTESSLRVAKEELTAVYEGAPKFDEDPSDNKEDWHCEELICKALGLEDSFKAKQNSEGNFTDAKGLECTSTFKSDDKEDLEVPTQLESQMSKDLTTFIQMEELRLQQPIPCSHSYCLDKKSCKFSREEGLVFDPGGSMQNSWSKSVINLVDQQHVSQQACLPMLTTEEPVGKKSEKKMEDEPTVGKELDMIEEIEELPDAALETYYTVEPIYDEEPEENHEFWPEQKVILAALKGDNLDSSNLLQSELFTSERLEVELRNKPKKVFENGDKPKLVDNKGEEKEDVVEKESSIILANIRGLSEDVFCRNSLAAANFDSGGSSYIKSGEHNVHTFDFGAYVQDDQLTCVTDMFKEMTMNKVNLNEVAKLQSTCSQPGQWQEMLSLKFLAVEQLLKEHHEWRRKMYVVQIVDSTGLQSQDNKNINGETDRTINKMNQQYVDYMGAGLKLIPNRFQYMVLGQGRPERNRSMSHEYHEVSRKKVIIYIYDPGGDSNCFHGVLLGVPAGILKTQQLLQAVPLEKSCIRKEEQA